MGKGENGGDSCQGVGTSRTAPEERSIHNTPQRGIVQGRDQPGETVVWRSEPAIEPGLEQGHVQRVVRQGYNPRWIGIHGWRDVTLQKDRSRLHAPVNPAIPDV